ncbi:MULTISPECIES: DNA repair protein RecO [unclassified Undibacterium]|uniref:DNA repair protein RecO n=1 Tax=unclassified Undibacterium TaxID=2630295 RepID=UPI002AC9EBC9|nr:MULTISPECIES: DNA repair protein RecO [unclassified Undibacterium]MEB0138019.1 DNA repair protein RecO [Undibacterium sp. CCC2.1]MEB0171243.1 DNA repair protein RecO [Undibacterium sp. CCC1.1]MEB0175288.1 DNA repair protein RecO [Undibacterium sp. CCC3.4]MEB0217001.1 DNA repair protein RecO [Undibacterium sp. 5I2]WPX42463.1 DNA repair protein RecO [Undibacterium sp. CCC3.4]
MSEAVSVVDSAVASAARKAIPKRPPSVRELRVHQQPGFVLHSWPHKETSLIIDVLTRDYGRIALVAKGAKRPHSQLRSVLQTFQPLQLSWTGKSELRILTGADWVGGMLPLEKSALLCGFYLNELLVKFLMRDEAHAALFDQYVASLNQLGHQQAAPTVLRQFELVLLRESGLLSDLSFCTHSRTSVLAEQSYIIDPELGARPVRIDDAAPVVLGKTLLDMCAADYSDAQTRYQSKMLMRFLLTHHLHGAVLNTRQILIDLQNL